MSFGIVSDTGSDVLRFMRLLLFFLLAGRAWQLWLADFPAGIWLEDQGMMPWLAEAFGLSWNEWVTGGYSESAIRGVTRVFSGILWALALGLYWPWFSENRRRVWGYGFGALVLLFWALAQWFDAFYRMGVPGEMAMQVVMPVLWIMYVRTGLTSGWEWLARLAIAATFLGHGLFAVGWYPVPGHFPDMLTTIFPIRESQAYTILYVAGILDFVVACGALFPAITAYVLPWAIIWGFATALARLASVAGDPARAEVWLQQLPQVLYRLPHGGLPLLLWWGIRRRLFLNRLL